MTHISCPIEFAGLFMAVQPRIIACGKSVASFAMGVRFLTGPAVMAAASIAVGLRGTLLHIAIVQVRRISNKILINQTHSHSHSFINHIYPCRLLFHKELFHSCSPRNTMFILIYSAQRKYHHHPPLHPCMNLRLYI